MPRPESEIERRRWPRLPLSIPVFVRAHGEDGKDFLEFATAVNVAAGGALVMVRRSLPPAARVLLEVPTPPSPPLAPRPKSSRVLRARILRVTHAEGYYLMGLKFLRPLVAETRNGSAGRRKVASLV